MAAKLHVDLNIKNCSKTPLQKLQLFLEHILTDNDFTHSYLHTSNVCYFFHHAYDFTISTFLYKTKFINTYFICL